MLSDAAQARSQSQYVAELQDMVEELQAAQSLVQDQRHSHQAEVRVKRPCKSQGGPVRCCASPSSQGTVVSMRGSASVCPFSGFDNATLHVGAHCKAVRSV